MNVLDSSQTHSKIGMLIRKFLTKKNTPIIIALLAMILASPSMTSGLLFDDYYHKFLVTNKTIFKETNDASLFELFSFMNGDIERNTQIMDMGMLPWWTLKTLKVSFWRPLAEITHWIDYTILTEFPALMHFHSMLWFGALILVLGLFYRRTMGMVWAAGLAILLYAIDDARSFPVTWLSARNSIMATFFGVVTLINHDMWRKSNNNKYAVFGTLTMLLGLLSGEAALATTLYLFSYALFLDENSTIKQKITSLLPYAAITLIWLITYNKLGFGTYGSGLYFDPAKEPLVYFQKVLQHFPVLFLAQFGTPPAYTYYTFNAAGMKMITAGGYVFFAILAALFFPVIRRDKTARFFALGMMLSFALISATLPSERNLFFVAIGGMGLLAVFLTSWFDKIIGVNYNKLVRFFVKSIVVFFVIIHFIATIPLFLVSTIPHKIFNLEISLKESVVVPKYKDHRITLVKVLAPGEFLGRISERLSAGKSFTKVFVLPCLKDSSINITRINNNSIKVKLVDVNWQNSKFENYVFRGTNYPMKKGEVVKLSDVSVKVIQVMNNYLPNEYIVTYKKSIDAQGNDFIIWDKKTNSYKKITMPKIGKSLFIDKKDFIKAPKK